MKSDTYEELNNALRNLCEERTFLQSQIEENNLHIQQTQSLNHKIIDSEDEDFRIFSPRKHKNHYKNELEQSDIEKIDYKTQNSQLNRNMEKLNSLIKIMQDVLEDNADNNLYENLEHVLHRVELSIKFISQDPDRAKMELSIVSENLRHILYQNIEES